MLKDELTKHFSHRLRESMIAAGFDSARSPSGVNLQKLQEITSYSLQICRKYLRGDALPEVNKIVDIANALHVSPGWLLFGDDYCQKTASSEHITMSKTLLHYLYTQINRLYASSPMIHDFPDFLMTLTSDLSEINASETQSKRIIDLALSSLTHTRSQQKAS